MSATSKLTVNVANPANNLIFARITAAQRDAHFDSNNPPEVGMLIFNDDDKVLEFWNGTEWLVALGERTGGAGVTVYDFQSFEYEEFTTTRTGPSLTDVQNRISGNDNWKSNPSYLSVNSGVWTWTIPSTGNYKIECWGAKGGRSNGWGPAGGNGAYAQGTMRLRGGENLKIVVGRMGTNNYYDAGGGGGTYVCTEDNEALVVAGGGGGGSASGMGPGPGPQYGNNSPNGGSTYQNSGGSGGGGGGANGPAGGGGGVSGNGQGGWGGQSFANGSVGGPNANGGFGGGGGGGGTNGAGGGGGYSGGAASRWSFYGAGGGSFVTSDATSQQLTANNRSTHGKVAITKV